VTSLDHRQPRRLVRPVGDDQRRAAVRRREQLAGPAQRGEPRGVRGVGGGDPQVRPQGAVEIVKSENEAFGVVSQSASAAAIFMGYCAVMRRA